MKTNKTDSQGLTEVFLLFGKLGFIAFGGPAAHIAMIENEVVSKRAWMNREHFLDLVGVTNLIPGPNSTEVVMHCGYQRAGTVGLFVAGLSFILPAILLTVILAHFYALYGKLPEIQPFMFGIQAAVLAIILDAVLKFGQKAFKSGKLWALGFLVLLGAVYGISEIILVLMAGIIGIMLLRNTNKHTHTQMLIFASPSTLKLFAVFLQVGSVLFGSGYVLFAYLQDELVHKLHWLTQNQLMDAIAVGQFTPGPVLSSATFIGYQISGCKGALVATLGIFLPSFFFVLLCNPLIPKLRNSKLASTFLDSVNVASVTIMFSALIELGQNTLHDWKNVLIALVSLIFVFRIKNLNSTWVVLFGSTAGYLLSIIRF